MSGDGKKPILKLEAFPLKIAVWENEREGKKYYTAKLQRVFKDQDGQWRDTEYLHTRDLPAAAELLLEVYRTIEIKEAGKPKPPTPEETPW